MFDPTPSSDPTKGTAWRQQILSVHKTCLHLDESDLSFALTFSSSSPSFTSSQKVQEVLETDKCKGHAGPSFPYRHVNAHPHTDTQRLDRSHTCGCATCYMLPSWFHMYSRRTQVPEMTSFVLLSKENLRPLSQIRDFMYFRTISYNHSHQ